MEHSSKDTIVAVATAPGRGALDVVRLSGPRAAEICAAFIRPDPRKKPARHNFAARAQGVGGVLDRLTCVRFEAPKSYTGQDAVELCCHGGGTIARRLVELAVESGARPAGPGEFTRRAYEAGKLDLLQAEAVGALADARSAAGVRLLERQLGGALSKKIGDLRGRLLDLSARLEAELAYPDDVPPTSGAELSAGIYGIREELNDLAGTAAFARAAISGAAVVLVGAENVGKSSLFNRLLGAEAALVTPTPGTTRDALSGELRLGDISVTLYDTAGRPELFRDEISALAAGRAALAAGAADLLLLVVEAGDPAVPGWAGEEIPRTPTLVLVNKSDLAAEGQISSAVQRLAGETGLPSERVLAVSAKTGRGLGELRDQMAARITPPDMDAALTSARQADGVSRAIHSLTEARKALDGSIWDAAAVEIAEARRALEEVLGRVTDEEVLTKIFSTFCVGK
ncbi:MAG TPA: tRNA uridine-5-carboxymethylaminomethyl(34) synthesis GTPase MnmE [bacterium]|nr:tRNA uridine-5-carboxymethylaminomethyl(34) synthesis GTPase MnmE [bacterium]